jgi:hypothetical protein
MSLSDIIEMLNGPTPGSDHQASVSLAKYRAHIEQLRRRRNQVDEAIDALRAACQRLEGDRIATDRRSAPDRPAMSAPGATRTNEWVLPNCVGLRVKEL